MSASDAAPAGLRAPLLSPTSPSSLSVATTPRQTHLVLVRGAPAQPERAPLPYRHVATYSVGHVLNDMAAAVWFSYLLLYLQEAEGLSGTQAGGVMFAGQLADALATPLVGLASDAGRGCCLLGRRKAWNLAGVVTVAFNFAAMFCCSLLPGWGALASGSRAAALGLFAALFNVGWAAVQVSHMSLVPELTRDEGERVLLNSARYAFTVLSNCAVFLVMLYLLPSAGSASDSSTDAQYKQPRVYQDLASIVLLVGLGCSAVFLLLGKEPSAEELRAREEQGSAKEGREVGTGGEIAQAPLSEEEASRLPLLQHQAADSAASQQQAQAQAQGEPASERRGSGDEEAYYPVHSARDWLRVPDFWRVMAVYMLVRLSVNISQVYLTFFVTETLQMTQSAVAVTPLLLYLAQLLSTLCSRRVALRLGRRRSIFAGSALTIVAGASMLLVQPGAASPIVYLSVVLLGGGWR